jgi:xylose isomerase
MFKEKARRFNEDKEIQALLAEVNADDGSMNSFKGKFTPEKAQALLAYPFDRIQISKRGLKYERLDQLTVDLLLGTR